MRYTIKKMEDGYGVFLNGVFIFHCETKEEASAAIEADRPTMMEYFAEHPEDF